MTYNSEWSIGGGMNASPDPWAAYRDKYNAAGGYAGTGKDLFQWMQNQNQKAEGAQNLANDRASLASWMRTMQNNPMTGQYINMAREAADPFAAQRGQYQGQLNSLMANPGSFSSSPAYKFAYDQGLEAVNRNLAAKGLANSGTRLNELTRFGQGMAGQQYFNQANLLAKLAGVDASNPGAAAGAITSIANQQNNPAEWARLWETGREANQANDLGVAKLGNVLKPYYAYTGY